jgi:protein-tyrosine phosphatase
VTTFRLLFVCTGNVCRSPFAERLLSVCLRDLGSEPGGLRVESAGIRALVGQPMERNAADALVERGGDPRGFTARRLTEELVANADLVLGAERAHREAAVRLHPVALARSFTLREFVRLVAADRPRGTTPIERLRSSVRLAAQSRGRVPAVRSGEDDIPDPFGRAPAVMAACADQIAAAVADIVRLLSPEPAPDIGAIAVPTAACAPQFLVVPGRSRPESRRSAQ